MRTSLAILVALCMGSCATVPEPGWAPQASGCVDKGLYGALAWPEAAELGQTDIRIGRVPNNEIGALVHFKRNFAGLGEFVAPPQVVLSVGDFGKRTCSVVLEERDCPVAARLYQELATAEVPVAFLHDAPVGLSVLHGTMYFLASRDGRNGTMHWMYFGAPAHPIEQRIDSVIDELAECMTPATTAYHAGQWGLARP